MAGLYTSGQVGYIHVQPIQYWKGAGALPTQIQYDKVPLMPKPWTKKTKKQIIPVLKPKESDKIKSLKFSTVLKK